MFLDSLKAYHGHTIWMFCWTELAAEHVGLIQSLNSACKLPDINPTAYLIDEHEGVRDATDGKNKYINLSEKTSVSGQDKISPVHSYADHKQGEAAR